MTQFHGAGFGLLLLLSAAAAFAATTSPEPSLEQEARSAAQALRAKHGDKEAARIERGVAQVRRLWRPVDGDAAAFGAFVRQEFIPEGPELDATFERFEFAMERIGGYFTSMERDLRRQVDLDLGPILPLDHLLAAFSPRAHLTDDLFATRIAFTCLLNFPLTTLEQRLKEGMTWSRRQWAQTRLAQGFSTRVPAEVNQKISAALSSADSYISTYNVVMHHLLDEKGRRLFPEKLRLITHWGLRDELKGRYAEPDGVDKQRMIEKVMERIVRQEIPAAVIDNPLLDWSPYSNKVAVSGVSDLEPVPGKTTAAATERENDERYRIWRDVYRAVREADPFNPDNPTFIDRRFNIDREIPETEVRALFETILSSPLAPRVARLIEKRLGRPLEPFDIWYAGFKPRGKYSEAELDTATTRRYPTAAAYAADIPRLLADLGFTKDQAAFLAAHIEVDPSRGAGHAMGATRRDDKAHLRTRVGPAGMDYKGYNIAVHEMGHNIEQTFSLNYIDYYTLSGVPNTTAVTFNLSISLMTSFMYSPFAAGYSLGVHSSWTHPNGASLVAGSDAVNFAVFGHIGTALGPESSIA